MAVKQKGRRKLLVEGRKFLWEVREDDEFFAPPGPTRRIALYAEDRSFIVNYHLRQPEETRHITLLVGRCGDVIASGTWRRFRCPRWESAEGSVAPGALRRIIEWCLAPEHRVEVDYMGREL